MIDSGMFEILSKKKIEIHSRSVFLQGLLLMNSHSRPKKFAQWNKLWTLWSEWLNDNNLSALEASLRYAISVSEISNILVGVETKKQLKEIFEASSGYLPEIPYELCSDDELLLNPSNWDKL
jgi:aryl-alcohol dehydrogenase-like predicted oxidoreductase